MSWSESGLTTAEASFLPPASYFQNVVQAKRLYGVSLSIGLFLLKVECQNDRRHIAKAILSYTSWQVRQHMTDVGVFVQSQQA